ncbi:AAA family ATPase [Chitiniphilus purpureus]|uniref:AAA family ATPase n=1 Tax=Chitiniphilus purpureus TaxID=2981137 RepID=A0ABY6DI17_9NEIS|nr:helix-turn-helix domain-containing protein [Chitiniphilus sp. CD1]UXY13966.1 AAA family ATPase [Chitiniphilus sp. CD1]
MSTLHSNALDGRVILNAERLKALRKQHGLSQEALAQRCFEQRLCVAIASIKRAEAGKPVLYRTARHLATLFECELGALVHHSEATAAAPAGQAADIVAEAPRVVIELALHGALPAETAALQAMVQAFGGMPADGSGGWRALFGVPRAYRSDAQRALQCAIALADALAARRMACTLALRTGQWPDPDTQIPLPEAPGEILVSTGLTHQLAASHAFVPWGDGDFRRLDMTVPAGQGGGHALIGRDAELKQLRLLLETTVADQAGQVLYIRGMAGIGKSRLMAELADMAQQGQLVCHPVVVLDFGGGSDQGALAQLARSLLGVAPGSQGDALAAALAREAGPDDQTKAMALHALLGLPQPPLLAPLYAAMTSAARLQCQVDTLSTLLLRQALRQPLLVSIEDVHWADAALFTGLGAIMQAVREAPVIWALSSRFEQDPLDGLLRPYLAELPLTILDLAPLRGPAAASLAAQFVQVDPGYREQCVVRAQGNPLFLTQLLLAGRGGALPDSLRHLVQAKLDQLSARDRNALKLAAAIGQRFSLAQLRELLDAPDYEPVLPQRHYLVRPADAQGGWMFVHDLILQEIYSGIAPAQRQHLHLRLAAHYAGRDEALCAQHLHKARSDEAPASYLRAIRAGIARYDYPQALALAEQCRAIDFAPVDEYTLDLLWGLAAEKSAQTQLARAHYEAALARAGDVAARLPAALGLARMLNVLEALPAEEALLDGLLPQAAAAGDEAALAHIHYLKGNLSFPRGEVERCRQHHEQALRHARAAGAVDMQVRALGGLGDAHYVAGRMGTAQRAFAECLALCEAHGLADIEASNRFMLATTRLYGNETEAALADALASAQLGCRVGNRRAEIVSRLTAGWLWLSLEQAAAAAEEVGLALTLARSMGAARFEAFLLESQARIALLQGDAEAARQAIGAAWALVERQGLQHFIGPWVLGTLAVLTPDAAPRAAALEMAGQLLTQRCVGHNHYRGRVAAAEACLLYGETEAARHHAAQLLAFTAPEPCAWADHHAALITACADWLDRPDAAHRTVLAQQVALGRAAGLAGVMTALTARGWLL